jgi:hypothetical protein
LLNINGFFSALREFINKCVGRRRLKEDWCSLTFRASFTFSPFRPTGLAYTAPSRPVSSQSPTVTFSVRPLSHLL